MAIQLDHRKLVSCGLDPAAAGQVERRIAELDGALPAEQTWERVSRELLRPEYPFAVHRYLYDAVFAARSNQRHGPQPAWLPSNTEQSNVANLMRLTGRDTYSDLYDWSIRNREVFWRTMIDLLDIRLERPYSSVIDLSEGVERARWLKDARLNIVNSCFNAPLDSPAIVYQKERGNLQSMSIGEFRSLTFRVARGLTDMGIKPGERVAVIMPMTVEASAVYLGAVAAGCAVATIADIFAPEEMRVRLGVTQPVCVFTQDHIIRGGRRRPLYERVKAAEAPRTVVVPAGDSSDSELRTFDIPWDGFLANSDSFAPVCTDPDATTTILFSSGTTALPKAIPWTQITPIKAAIDGHLHHDIRRGDMVCWPTNLGWMMGPWLLYASLMNKATVALYYGAPTSREFGTFVERARVTMLGLVPSLVSVWKSSGCMSGMDWSGIRAFSSTGECSNPHDMLFLMSLAGYRPIIEYCGGTEIGGGYISGTVVQPCLPGTFSTPALGSEIVILDDANHVSDVGELYLVPPAIGLSQSLVNGDHHEVYYAGVPRCPDGRLLRRHGDRFERLPNGYFRARGRVDDAMNLGGIKISSIHIEEILGTVQDVQEVAVVGVPPGSGGPDRLVVYAVADPDSAIEAARLKSKMQRLIQEKLSSLFKIHEVVLIDSLPRTASKKIMRRSLRSDYLARPHQHA